MNFSNQDCCILNNGSGAWAFEPLACQLSRFLRVEISDRSRRFNYLLHVEDIASVESANLFIPLNAVRLASDKRLLAEVFHQQNIPMPQTELLDTYDQVLQFIRGDTNREWCLKYPTSCGANGHRMISAETAEPANWPRPFVVQEFVRLEAPEVYRIYCAAGELFGWVARRYPKGARSSPWVAHAQGARYVVLDEAPRNAKKAAQQALVATGLWDSFGCVDLIRKPTGEWLVLEVGTDGLFNHVDRDIGDPEFERELNQHVAEAFWKWTVSIGNQQ